MIPKVVITKCLARLKDELKEKRLTYKFLADALDISEVSVKRLLNHHTITLERLLEIAEVLELDAAELLGSALAKPEHTFFNDEQDAAFFEHPYLQSYFEQLFSRKKTPADIAKEFELNDASTHLYLRKLEKLGLLSIGANQNLTFLVSEPIGFAPNSRVSRAKIKTAVNETCDRVLNQQADGDLMLVRELGLDNVVYGQLMKELSQVVGRYSELSSHRSGSTGRYRVAVFSHSVEEKNGMSTDVDPVNVKRF